MSPTMRLLALCALLPCALALCACGGASTRAAMPDVASTDRSADDLGLAPLEEPGTGSDTGTDTGSDTGTGPDPAPASGTR